MIFWTDHPCFAPLDEEKREHEGKEQVWPSVEWNVKAVRGAVGEGTKEMGEVMGGNAVRILRLRE